MLCILTLAASTGCGTQPESDEWNVQITQIVPKTYPHFDIYFSLRDAHGVQKDLFDSGLTASAKPSEVTGRAVVGPLGGIHAVLVLDISSSMSYRFSNHGARRIDVVRQSAELFVDKMSDDDQCALVPFGTTIGPLDSSGDPGPISWLDKNSARRELRNLPTRSNEEHGEPGQLPSSAKYLDYHVSRLYDGINAALDFVKAKGHGVRTPIIVLTDGYDDSYSLILGSELEHVLAKETGRKAVHEKAVEAGIPLYMIGIGEPGHSRPDASLLKSGKSSDRDLYSKQAAQFLDRNTLQYLAGSSHSPNMTIVQTAEVLKNYYPRILHDFQHEVKISCTGNEVVDQDVDPGVQVVLTDRSSGKQYVSNIAQQSFMLPTAPPPGHPGYVQFIRKRIVLFSLGSLTLLAAWGLPLLFGLHQHEKGTLVALHGSRQPLFESPPKPSNTTVLQRSPAVPLPTQPTGSPSAPGGLPMQNPVVSIQPSPAYPPVSAPQTTGSSPAAGTPLPGGAAPFRPASAPPPSSPGVGAPGRMPVIQILQQEALPEDKDLFQGRNSSGGP